LITLVLIAEYRLISKKGEGTFSEVLKAQSIKTGKYVAIKCMKNHFDTIEQVSIHTRGILLMLVWFVLGEQLERDISVAAIVAPSADHQTL
jgi:serine/threonine protein kinase